MFSRLRYHRHLQMAYMHLKNLPNARVQYRAPHRRPMEDGESTMKGLVGSIEMNLTHTQQPHSVALVSVYKKIYNHFKKDLKTLLRESPKHHLNKDDPRLDAAIDMQTVVIYNGATHCVTENEKLVEIYVRCNPNYQKNGPWYDAAIVS